MEPGSAGADIGKSAAELAYAQLESLWKKTGQGVADVVLVVPGAYRTEQLGLLLGLAQECGMPVRALVDAAAAASVRPYPKQQLLYVDAGFYRVSVTLVDQNGEAQVRTEHALAQGLGGVHDMFARRVADHFVRATRFDPFAHADTEQALYDRLPGVARDARPRGTHRALVEASRRGISCDGRARCRARRGARVLPRRRAAHRAASRGRQAPRRAGVRSNCGHAGIRRRAIPARRLAHRSVWRRGTPRAACCWREGSSRRSRRHK